jgi:uncharacterized ferritin-like protein (DUF455 family)
MDWTPFVVCDEKARAPRARGINVPEGLGDRLRTAAFAERQAVEAFRWAADRFENAPNELRQAWRDFAAEEAKHLGWIIERMKELGVDPAGRLVSDSLWRALSSTTDHLDFARLMVSAEERGKAAEESFCRSLETKDPITAEIFGRIAVEEEHHIGFQRGLIGS